MTENSDTVVKNNQTKEELSKALREHDWQYELRWLFYDCVQYTRDEADESLGAEDIIDLVTLEKIQNVYDNALSKQFADVVGEDDVNAIILKLRDEIVANIDLKISWKQSEDI